MNKEGNTFTPSMHQRHLNRLFLHGFKVTILQPNDKENLEFLIFIGQAPNTVVVLSLLHC